MTRPRSEKRREAILEAATILVAEKGTEAATAQIAKHAAVPHGSVFTYFSTKNELLNCLYLEIKRDLTQSILDEIKFGDDTRNQVCQLWTAWTRWGAKNTDKRRDTCPTECRSIDYPQYT